eukprot:TRINITY_DN45441_c0_g1_i1.p1 TRINITY_DN45441_c0_g1~~TRINITY_DN45441_c0_g1_i1.p1  ORF type:complete len:500 (-),score=19.94 TRINITY_DN45441_c0_g1_i1:327-1826(-)
MMKSSTLDKAAESTEPLINPSRVDGDALDDSSPELRPLRDGYCAVYRPSLTDSKLRSFSESLVDQYKLLPSTWPKRRPWLQAKHCESLHLEHQVYRKEQGIMCFMMPGANESNTSPRLGVEMSVQRLAAVEPACLRWRGNVRLRLYVALKETMGIRPKGCVPSSILKAHWPRLIEDVSGESDAFAFLATVFGVRFSNLILDDIDWQPTISGPDAFDQLNVEDGLVSGEWTVSGCFYSPVDLRNFPFDVCAWDAIISIIGWSPGLKYDWSSLRNFCEFEVFGLHGLAHPSQHRWFPYVCEQTVVPNSARLGESFINCRFHTRRKPSSILNTVVMPMALAACVGYLSMAQASGWITNKLAATDPLALQAGLLLTVVAIRFTTSDSLPKGLGVPTLVDRYGTAVLVLLTFSMFSMAQWTHEDLDAMGAPYLYASMMVLLHGVFAIIAWSVWAVRAASQDQEKLYASPHDIDEIIDNNYLYPGPRNMLDTVTIGFARKARDIP